MSKNDFDSLTPAGFEQLTSINAATALASPKGTLYDATKTYTAARLAVISVEGANVRYRDDGTNPTAAIGVQVQMNLQPFVYNGDLTKVRFIDAAGAGAAKVNVSYYR